MEYYKKLKELFSMETVAGMRLEQLEREGKIDARLQECNKTCSDQVMRYLFNMRRLNRLHAKKVHGLPILDYPEQMKKAYSDVRSIEKHFWWEHPYMTEPVGNSYHRWDHTDGNMRPCDNICTQFLPKMNELIEKGLENHNEPIVESFR